MSEKEYQQISFIESCQNFYIWKNIEYIWPRLGKDFYS